MECILACLEIIPWWAWVLLIIAAVVAAIIIYYASPVLIGIVVSVPKAALSGLGGTIGATLLSCASGCFG